MRIQPRADIIGGTRQEMPFDQPHYLPSFQAEFGTLLQETFIGRRYTTRLRRRFSEAQRSSHRTQVSDDPISNPHNKGQGTFSPTTAMLL